MKITLRNEDFVGKIKSINSTRKVLKIGLMTAFIFCLLISPVVEAQPSLAITPSYPAVGDTLKIVGNGYTPGDSINCVVTYSKTVSVIDGQYQFALYRLAIPSFDTQYSVTASGVQDLFVEVEKGLTYTLSADASEGVATITKGNIPPMDYNILIYGQSGQSSVVLKFTASETVTADSNGNFEYDYDTSSLPSGKFDINAGGATGSVNLYPGGFQPNPQLTITMTANPKIYSTVGQPITYTYTVTNTGNIPVNNVMVNDETYHADLGTLDPGSSGTSTRTYYITQADITAGSVSNSAFATGAFDGGSVNSIPVAATITAKQSAELTITKTANPTYYSAVGQKITYTYTVTNSGIVPVSNIAVTDDRNTVSINSGTLAPGASRTGTGIYTIKLMDLAGPYLTNYATATGTYNGKTVTSLPVTATIYRQNPALTITKKANPTTYSAAGQTITYTYTVTNIGDVPISSIAVTDNKNTVVIDSSTLAPGSSRIGTGTYTITQADITAGSVTNSATVTGKFNGQTVTSAQATATVNAIQSPSLSLTKTPSPTTYNAVGQKIAYTYTVTNSGNVPVSSIAVTDNKNTVRINSGTLAPGSSVTGTGTYIITQADLNAGTVTNSATATGSFNGQTVTSAPATATVFATQSAGLKITKTASPTTYNAVGQKITYTYTVTNSGNVPVDGIAVSDNKNIVSINSGTLAPGSSVTGTGTYTITQADINAGSVTNSATATGTFNEKAVTSAPATATVTAVQSPALKITKTASPTTYNTVGQKITYTYTVTNTGNVPVSSIAVSDNKNAVTINSATLDPGLSVTGTGTYTITQADITAGSVANSATATGKFNGQTVTSTTVTATVTATQSPALTLAKTASPTTYSTAGQTITYTYTVTNTGNVPLSGIAVTDNKNTVTISSATLAPGSSVTGTGTYTITQADITAGSVTNSATAKGTFNGKTVTSAPATATVTATQNPVLTLTKTASPTTYSTVGQKITYTYTVTNTGNVPVSSIAVSDNKNTVTINSGTLAPGSSRTGTGTYTITQADITAGSVANSATATGTFNGKTVTSASATATVTAVQSPALKITKTANPKTYNIVGQTITYTYTVTNSGNVPVDGIAVSDNKNIAVSISSAILAPGSSVTGTGTYTITQADINTGSVTNSATATGTFNEKAVTSAPATATVTAVQSPALKITKTASPTTYNTVGQKITYTYTVTNTGNVPVSSIAVTDNKNAVTISSATLDPGLSATGTGTYTITQADITAGSVTNSATAKGTFNGKTVTSAPATATVTATQSPALTLTKTASPTTYNAVGQTIAFTYTVTNSGNVPISSIKVTDSTNSVSINSGTLAPGSSVAGTGTYTIKQADITAGSVTNSATAKGTFNGKAVTSAPATATVTAVQSPALKLTVTETPTTYSTVGQKITYTFTVTNSGNVPVSNIVLTGWNIDQWPPEINIGTLAPGSSAKATATHTITQADINTGGVTGGATQAYGTFNGKTVNSNDALIGAVAIQNPALKITKTASPTTYHSAGQVITYTYTVTNTGNVPLGSIAVSDNKNTVSINSATLAPGSSVTGTGMYTIKQADITARSVTNTASATGTFTGNIVKTVTSTSVTAKVSYR